MELRCRHNARSIEITQGVHAHVSVKTFDNNAWEHISFCDFIEHSVLQFGKLIERKVICNSWRTSSDEPWIFLEKEDYVVGVVVNSKLYILVKNNQPYIKHDKDLLLTAQQPLATVHSIAAKKSTAS